jgi:hypothetical protein
MNDTEYNHPIWLNDRFLSNEFHYAWSILAFSDTWFSGKHQRIAMRFHYASLSPIQLNNRCIFALGLHLKNNQKKIESWFNHYGEDLASINCYQLILNICSDSEILIKETANSKKAFSLVYRKSIPDGGIEQLERTVFGIDRYLLKNGL